MQNTSFSRFARANNAYLWALFALAFLYSGCGTDYVFEKAHRIGAKGWAYTDVLDYEVTIADTTSIYNLFLELEHGVTYPKQNLYVRIHTKFPNGEHLKEQVSLELADKAGKWYGDCSSEICKTTIPLQEGAYFSQAGTYIFSVEQFMREDLLRAVNGVRLMLEKTEHQR